MWTLRWRLGTRLLMMAACYVLPRCATRDDLCLGLTNWSRSWVQRLNEERRRTLVRDVKATTKEWQA